MGHHGYKGYLHCDGYSAYDLSSIKTSIKEQQLDADSAYHYRNEHAAPLIDEFKAWLDENRPKTPPKSLIETCKAHGVEPYDWFKHVLAKLPECQTVAELESLLPFNLTLSTL